MKKAILMMTFGSPEEITFEGVADFFTNIRRGVRPQDHEIQTLYDNYVLIGGTPLQKITREEVALVEARLGNEYSVYFANKFSRPFIPDVIGQMEADGIEQCICLILEPHYSFYSVMGYEKFLESKQIQFLVIKDWYQEEALLNYWADEIGKILKEEVKQELTLDAGKSKGASENMLAIANGGLIGSVSKVEDNSTMVNLLTNTENADKISVKIQHGSTTIYGIIVGYDKENEVLKISQLNSSGDISAGDKVTTGGLGNFNVADIPVGEVVATTHSTDYLTREVTVKLSADTHNVSVIELVGNS